MPEKNKIIIVIGIVILIAVGGAVFYFADKNTGAGEESPAAVSTNQSEVPSMVINLVGVVKEKGESWIIVEDRTPQPPTAGEEKPAAGSVKVFINSGTKITKGGQPENFQVIKVGDFMLAKTTEASDGEATAGEIDIVP